MAIAYYLTHPQVAIDPSIPVPQWGLSAVGRRRAQRAARADWAAGIAHIVASAENKAVETAAIFADALGVQPVSDPAFNENDRSATGYLPPAAFEAMADAFFASPDRSARGWERAVDAQARIVSAVAGVLDHLDDDGDVLFVGHGAVGTLLLCHAAALPIARRHDQPAGGGNLFALDIASRRLIFGWRSADSSGPGTTS